MSDDAKSLPFQAAREVDRICDEFESQIQAGKQPRIEDILAGSTEIDRNHLLQSLLRVELELLGRQSQLSPQNSYEKRFPQDLEIVRRAFSEWRKKSAGTEPGNQTRIGNAPRRKETVSLNNPAVESSRIGVRKKQSSENPDLETFGKFQVKRVLGKGGFGTVYHAYDPQLDRDVAVKVPLLSSLDTPELLERFLREARATATLRHANICPVYEIGELDQQPYIVMAFIQGLPLSAFINPDKPLTERQVAIIIRKVALALETAHRENVIHRDIKPDNIMIDRKSKEPVVMDFGLARRDSSQDTHLTQEGQIMGTPIYMPPEQAKGEVDKIGPRSDIYSLGVILYEMLSCERPFKGSIAEVLGAIVRDEPDPPSQHRPDLDPTMEAICLKAMAKKPEDRYQSMAELAQALGDFLKGTGTSGENAVVESGENANKKTEEPAGLTAFFNLSKEEQSPVDKYLAKKQQGWWKGLSPLTKAAIAVAAMFVVVAASLILFRTESGTVQIEILDPSLQVAFGKDTITIENDGKPIRVTPGTHSLAVSYDGIHFDVEESFEVTKNDEVRLRIERVGDQIIVHQGGSETAPLPNRVPLRPPVIESVELVHTLASDEKQVWDLAFSPDGKSLAAANNGGSVKVFDSSTGNLIHTLSDFDCPVFCVTYSHDGKILATGDSHRSTSGKQRSGTATLWSTNDWSKLSAVTDTKAVRSLAFTPDSNRLILGLGSSMPEDMLGRMEESQARMAERAGSGRGASGNMTFKMWQWGGLMIYDVPTNKAVPAPAVDSSRIVAVTPTNDGQKFASCGFRGELKLRDLENGVATLDLVEPPGSQYAVHDVAIAPNADVLAAGAPNGFLLYDVSEEKEILRNTTAGEVLSLSFSDDGRILATGHSGHPIQLWDTSTGKQLASIPVDWKVTTDLEFQPGGHLLAASSESDGTARIWDVQSSLSDRSLLSSNSTAQTISAADKASSAMDPVPSVDRADRPHFSDSEAPSLLVAPFSANEATQFQQNWAEYLGIPVRVRNSIGLEFVLIPPGEFLMGSPPDEEGRSELPRDFYHTHGDKGKGNPLPSGDQEQQHRVVISKPFYLATTELTQGQYEAVVGGSSRSIRAGKTSEHPVGMMGYRAQEFVGILNRRPEELPAIREYRLPTEAEWEFACRAGTKTVFHFGDSADRIQEFDWVVSNSNGQPHPVGEKTPNPFGLFDLHGNLREWCADVYAIYPEARVVDPFVKKDDPLVTGTGGAQVVRGGSYKTPATKSRSAWRFRSNTRTLYTEGFGVRLAASIQSDRALPVVPKRDDVSRTAPPEPSELKELRARTTALTGKPAADRDVITLREELTAFRLKHYGSPWTVEAAKLMTELRWPVDELTRGAIDPYELKVAGSGDIENVPRGLVHIMGDSRLKHWAHVEYLDFSPDGQTIVSASRDRSVVVWYTQSGRQKQILTGLPSNPRCARFSPDGESVAICCGMKEDASDAGTKEIVIWDLKQDKIDKKLTGGHTKPIRRVNWSGDGKKVVSWAYDNLVNIWDVRTGKVLKKIETEGTGGGMVPVCWKTNTLVVPFQSQRYQLWNLEYLKPHDRPEIQHEALQSVRCISNDGSLIAFMSEKDGKTILIWDVNTGKPVQTIKQSEGIIEARFTPDNKFLLIGDYGSYVKLWDLQSGKLATSPKEPYRENNASDMTAVAISANGAVYAHAGSAGKIAVRDFRTHELLLNPAKENTYGGGKLASAKMSYDGTLLATQGWGGCIDTWDPIMAKYNLRIFRSTLTPRAIDVSPDGAIVGYPRQWSSSPMLFLDAHKTENAKPYMKNFYGNECAFSPDGQHVAVATQEDKDRVFIHNYQSGKTITTISHPGGTAERMRYTPDGKYLVTNTYQGTSPVVYNPVTAERLPGFSGHKGIVQYFNFSPDGKCLISASSGARELKVWDFESRKVIQELIPASIREKTTGLTSPAYSPDGRWIMVTVGINSGAGYLLLWDAQTLELKHRCHYRTDSGILKGIRNVFFTLDGRHVIRADYNGTIKYFRISEMEKVDAIPEGTKT